MAKSKQVDKAKPETDLVALRVTEEILREIDGPGGRQKLTAVPWSHNVRVGKETYTKGQEFKTSKEIAAQLLATGAVQKASDPKTPFRPSNVDRSLVYLSGVLPAEEARGKIPTATAQSGEKGWSDYVDEE